MNVSKLIDERGIERVVHFTTNKGLIGILDSGYLKSRGILPEDKRLEFIVKHNSPTRKDVEQIRYVNLSITNINREFFNYCSKWHDDIFWCVLCFSPEILTHDGVIFTTTNNIYPSVQRGVGLNGLEKLFSETVLGKYGQSIVRQPTHPLNATTDIQAEVLYPEKIDIKYLQKIIVSSEDHADDVSGITYPLDRKWIAIETDEYIFK